MNTIRILLVDDNPMFLGITREFLQLQVELTVVGAAHNGREALVQAEKLKPDVILLDLNMPGLSGLETIPKLQKITPQAKIIALTMMNQEAYQPAALAAGADGFVAKGSMGAELVTTIQRVVKETGQPEQER
ncbi:MAG: putative two-component response regulator [Anaerolineaceae bacterium]|nr:MAG: putative two-component response regulator [Anaerolineaceae bacterium]